MLQNIKILNKLHIMVTLDDRHLYQENLSLKTMQYGLV